MARKAIVSAAIVRLMKGGKRHAWTLDDLQDGLARRGCTTDFSSVFRAAKKLAATGALRKLVLDDGRAHFELLSAHHDHLHCTHCHELVPMPCIIDRRDFAALERATGVAILEHHLILNGVCRNCRSAPEAKGGPARRTHGPDGGDMLGNPRLRRAEN